MNREEKLKVLRELNEKTLTERFLVPLYSEGMRCKNVQYVHGILEFGKDIIYCKEDEYGSPEYTGVQVKAVKINSRNISGILCQITEALGTPFRNLTDGKEKDLEKIVLVTSHEFTEKAKESLWRSLNAANLHRSVACIDGNMLVDLLDAYLPSAFWKEKSIPLNVWENALLRFKTMLESSDLLEEDFMMFFKENPWLLGVGLKYKNILPGQKAGADFRVDFLLERYDGYCDIIELKRHTDDVIVGGDKNWRLSARCNGAISQILRYMDYYERNVARECYDSGIDVYKPKALVIIGRTKTANVKRKIRLINDQYSSVEILTYDDLYENAERLIETLRQFQRCNL